MKKYAFFLMAAAVVLAAACKDEEKSVPVADVKLNKTEITLEVGKKAILAPTVIPKDATNTGIKWNSSKPEVATVDDGMVVAVTAGTTDIIVTTDDGGKQAICTVRVIIPVGGIGLNKTSLQLAKGEKFHLEPVFNPLDASIQEVTWTSSDPTVAAVSDDGWVTANSAGTATITVIAVNGGRRTTCEVTVIIPVTGVGLSETILTLSVDDTAQLEATVKPDNATNKGVSWSIVSNPEGAITITTDGNIAVVTAVGEGTATITVTTDDGEFEETCEVTASKAPVIEVTGVELNHTTLTLPLSKTAQLEATVKPGNAANKGVSWSIVSIPEGAVTITPNGNVAVVTAVNEGTATITVTTDDKGIKETCVITVVPLPELYKNLLQNPGFEEPLGGTRPNNAAYSEHWKIIPETWFTDYYVTIKQDPLGAGEAYNDNQTRPNNVFFTGTNAGVDFPTLRKGDYTARIWAQNTGGIFQIVNVAGDERYEFGLDVAIRRNNDNMSFKTHESVKILSVDGKTFYGEKFIPVNDIKTDGLRPYILIFGLKGEVDIPAGVNQVRFQFDQRHFTTPTGQQAPVFCVDECFFYRIPK